MIENKLDDGRVLCHFSCGIPSAVNAKLALEKYGHDKCEIIYIHVRQEHEDNMRFLKECEEWFGKEVKVLINEKYDGDVYDVIEQTRFIKSQYGAPCTKHLKQDVRIKYQRPNDIHTFGYTFEEQDRAERFESRNPHLNIDWLLIDNQLDRQDCFGIMKKVGIDIPAMYKLGYQNNNCIGCVKGGMGYWNKIRKDFPEVFARMSMVEREREHSILKDKTGPIYLDELDPNRGRMQDEVKFDCGIFCEMTYEDIVNISKTDNEGHNQ